MVWAVIMSNLPETIASLLAASVVFYGGRRFERWKLGRRHRKEMKLAGAARELR